MTAHVLPGLGMVRGWPLGANDWKSEPSGGMDRNLLLASVAAQLSIESRVTSLPSSPLEGQIYIVTGTVHENEIAAFANGAWEYIAPKTGWRAYDKFAEEFITFDGDEWIKEMHTAGAAFTVTRQAFTATGTWTKPAGLIYSDVFVVGSGAGGGYNTSGQYGANGSAASFGSHCTANGGSGNGNGGTATGGNINLTGATGMQVPPDTSSGASVPAAPSASVLGSTGAPGAGGHGGSGSAWGSRAGGAGGCSMKIIPAASLGSTETVTIGNAGNAYSGSGGVNGTKGIVIVTNVMQ